MNARRKGGLLYMYFCKLLLHIIFSIWSIIEGGNFFREKLGHYTLCSQSQKESQVQSE